MDYDNMKQEADGVGYGETPECKVVLNHVKEWIRTHLSDNTMAPEDEYVVLGKIVDICKERQSQITDDCFAACEEAARGEL